MGSIALNSTQWYCCTTYHENDAAGRPGELQFANNDAFHDERTKSKINPEMRFLPAPGRAPLCYCSYAHHTAYRTTSHVANGTGEAWRRRGSMIPVIDEVTVALELEIELQQAQASTQQQSAGVLVL